MQNFSIDSPERRIVPFALAAIALGLTALVHQIFAIMQVPLSGAVLPPSAFAVYGLLYAGFERYLWRWQLSRSVGLVKTPILDGAWKATMSSSLDDFKTEFTGPMSIAQTWTNVHIFFEGTDAFSHSQSASIRFMGPARISFIYVYQSEKRPEFANSEYLHFGTCRLLGTFGPDGMISQLEGSYFTDRSRNTYGRIRLERV